jgi:hypothetical protein
LLPIPYTPSVRPCILAHGVLVLALVHLAVAGVLVLALVHLAVAGVLVLACGASMGGMAGLQVLAMAL